MFDYIAGEKNFYIDKENIHNIVKLYIKRGKI
jgi:hypothetical protein